MGTRASLLVDTDILIDWLKGSKRVKGLVWSTDYKLYCSSLTRKELLSKSGLTATERQQIHRLLLRVRVYPLDSTIAAAASELLEKYKRFGLHASDALIAATAWVKQQPLLTRNVKHYNFIEEIELFKLEDLD